MQSSEFLLMMNRYAVFYSGIWNFELFHLDWKNSKLHTEIPLPLQTLQTMSNQVKVNIWSLILILVVNIIVLIRLAMIDKIDVVHWFMWIRMVQHMHLSINSPSWNVARYKEKPHYISIRSNSNLHILYPSNPRKPTDYINILYHS